MVFDPSADRAQVIAPVVATTGALTYAAMTALYPSALAPEIAPHLGVTPSLVGLQISIVYGGATLSTLFGGTLTGRFGACRATQLAMLLIGAGAALACLGSLAAFAIGSGLTGIGYGLTTPAASHLLMRVVPPKRRTLIFSIKQTGVPLGGVLAGATAPALALAFGWRGAFLCMASLALGVTLWLQRRRDAWDTDRNPAAPLLRSPLNDIRLVWNSRPLRFLSLAGLCFSAVQLCLSAFTVTMLVGDLGVGLVKAGLVMSAVQVSGVAGRVAWGWVGDRRRSGTGALILAAVVTMACALATTLMSPAWPLPVILGVLCLMGFSALGWNGVYLAEAARLAPAGAVARASGGSLFFTFSGVLMGPPAFAALHGLFGSYHRIFAALAAVAAVGLGLILLVRRAPGGLDI